MAADLMGGYTAYTNAPEIVAEATVEAHGPDLASTDTPTVSVIDWTVTYTV